MLPIPPLGVERLTRESPHKQLDVRFGVNRRTTQFEHFTSGLLSRADIMRTCRHVRVVPEGDIALQKKNEAANRGGLQWFEYK